MLDKTVIRRRLYGHGLLREPEEQEPPVPGGPTVEAERELVQVVVQMRLAHGTLMGPQQPALEQRRDAVDARKTLHRQILPPAQQGDPMTIASCLEPVVVVPPVGMH